MELDEDKEVVPDAETMEFYRIGPPVPSILRKPGERSKRLEISRRVSFSKDVSEGSSESLHRRLRFNAAPSGRTLRKKQTGVTPTPSLRSREYLKASAQEEVLRDLDDSDYAVPNLVFLTERPRRRRLRTPVVVLRRHPPPLVSQTPSPPTRRWNRTRSYRARRRSANVTTTTRRRRAKLTRKPMFQWRSKVLVSHLSTSETESTGGPPSVVEDDAALSLPPHHPEAIITENNVGDENALFPGNGGSIEDNYALGASDGSKGSDTRSLRGGLLDSHVTVEDTSGNDTALVGNDTEVANLTGPVVDDNVTSLGNTSGAGAEGQQDLSHKSSADVYKDDQTSSAGVEEVISSNALLSDEGGQVENGVGDHVVGNESSHSSYLVDEGTSSDTSATNVTTATLNLNATTQRPEVVVSQGVVNGTDTDYYD